MTIAEARRDVDSLIRRVVDDCEPTIVVTDAGAQVVVCPLDDYRAWTETEYLLRSPANAAHLRQSVAESRAGDYDQRELAAQ